VPFQILVVDDASEDATPRILKGLESEIPIRSIRNPARLGFGGSLRAGIAATSTQWVAFADADGQYDPRDLRILLGALSAENDLAVGRRSLRADPFPRKVISIGFRGLLYAFFGLRSKDPTSSLKAGPTESVRIVAERVRFMNGGFWNEFMIRWTRSGFSYIEVPIRHRPRPAGPSRVASRGSIVRVSVQQFIALLRTWREFHRVGLFPPDAAKSSSKPADLGR
jgi:dolichol-phosphate mannosyltransferase